VRVLHIEVLEDGSVYIIGKPSEAASYASVGAGHVRDGETKYEPAKGSPYNAEALRAALPHLVAAFGAPSRWTCYHAPRCETKAAHDTRNAAGVQVDCVYRLGLIAARPVGVANDEDDQTVMRAVLRRIAELEARVA